MVSTPDPPSTLLIFPQHTPSCSNAIAGETSLDRLANALGGKAVLPHIIANIPQMLQSGKLGVIVM